MSQPNVKQVSNIFDEHTNSNVIRRLPQAARGQSDDRAPWGLTKEGDLPPMMFQLWFADGRMASFPYSGIGELHCRDAGRIEVFVHAIAKTVVIIEGRHLRELAKRLSTAAVLWLRESDARELGPPESSPEITAITLEELPD
jgi:hypothetical protein